MMFTHCVQYSGNKERRHPATNECCRTKYLGSERVLVLLVLVLYAERESTV